MGNLNIELSKKDKLEVLDFMIDNIDGYKFLFICNIFGYSMLLKNNSYNISELRLEDIINYGMMWDNVIKYRDNMSKIFPELESMIYRVGIELKGDYKSNGELKYRRGDAWSLDGSNETKVEFKINKLKELRETL